MLHYRSGPVDSSTFRIPISFVILTTKGNPLEPEKRKVRKTPQGEALRGFVSFIVVFYPYYEFRGSLRSPLVSSLRCGPRGDALEPLAYTVKGEQRLRAMEAPEAQLDALKGYVFRQSVR